MAVVGSARVLVTPDFSSFGGLLKTGVLAGLASLGPGLAPAVGILGAVPGLALAGGSALGVLKLGFGGISDALKATSAAGGAAAKSAAADAASQISSANQIASANQAVTDAIRNQAAAQRQAAASATSDSQAIISAQKAVTASQLALTAARKDALATLQQLTDAQADNNLSVRQAQLDLQQAQIDANKTLLNPNSTNLQNQQAQLAVAEAQQKVVEAQQKQVSGASDLATAQKNGIDNSTQVVAAQQKEADAVQSLANAQAKAASDALNSQDSLVSASEAVASALRAQQLAYAQAASAAQSAGASGGAATKALSAAQQALVNELKSLEPAYDRLKVAVQNAFLPGVIQGIKDAATSMGILQTGLVGTGTALGTTFQNLGALLGSPAFKRDLPGLFDTTNGFLAKLGDAAVHSVDLFKNIAVAAEPLLTKLGGWIDDVFTRWDKDTTGIVNQDKLKKFFNETINVFQQLGSIGDSVFGILKDLIAPFFGISTTELGGLASALKDIKTYLDGIPPEQLKNVEIFLAALVGAAKLAPSIKLIGPALGALTGPVGLIAAAVAGVGFALYKLDPAFKTFVNNAVTDVKTGQWQKLADSITQPFSTNFKKAFGSNDPQSALGNTKTFKDGTTNNLKSLYSDIGAKTSDLVKNFAKDWQQAFGPNGSGTQMIAEFKKDIGPIFQDVVKIVDDTVTLIDAIWDRFGKYITNYIFNSLTDTLKVVRGIFDLLAGLFDLIVDILTGKWGKLWSDLGEIVKGFKEIIVGLLDGLKNELSTEFQIIASAVSAVWDKIWSELSGPVSTAFDAVATFITKTVPTQFTKALNSVDGAITGFVSTELTNMENFGKDIVNYIVKGIENAPANIGNALKGLLKGAAGSLGKLGGDLLGAAGIPGAAEGGVVTKPTLVMVGEGGEKEYIVPQSKLAAFVNAVSSKNNTSLNQKVPTASTGKQKAGLTINIEKQIIQTPTDVAMVNAATEMAVRLAGN